MPSDSIPSALSSLLNLGSKDPLDAKVEEVAAAWVTYESGMDWDPSYLVNMGTLDMDTDEFAAVDTAMQELKALSHAMGEDVPSLSQAVISQVEDAYHELCTMGWRVPDGTHEQVARRISAALGVAFTGRHGGGSSNNPC